MAERVLLVEDDKKLAVAVSTGLIEEGFAVEVAHATRDAEKAIKAAPPDIILLDLTLPGQDGLEWLADARTKAGIACPVIIVSGRGAVPERVAGLASGADDYITKPFAFAELVARIRTVLKRTRATQLVLKVAGLRIDLANRSVERDGVRMDLTAREYDLLVYLARNAGRPVSKDTLAREVWQIKSRATPFDNVIEVIVNRLRKKVDLPDQPSLILTIRGVGYQLTGDA